MVLLGATGDLAQRKLLPSLFDLYVRGELPEHFQLIGAAFDEHDDASFQAWVRELLGVDVPQVESFVTRLRYVQGDFTDDTFYQRVTNTVYEFNNFIGQCANVLYYLAVPPSLYRTMFDQLARNKSLDICAGLDAWARLLVEKPFGNDVKTAHALEEQLGRLFADEQIYRIDHYLAKSGIENVLALRFGNAILENVWNAECIESIDVTLYEDLDVADRGSFYDAVGALRDVGQNHLLQLLALLMMRRADVRDAADVRQARAQVVDSLRFTSTGRAPVRGQYEGYQAVDGVKEGSETETFFAFALKSVAPEWIGVNIRVAAGKALSETQQEAVVTFKPAVLDESGLACVGDTHTNTLRIIFKPEPRLYLRLATRTPGHDLEVHSHEYELVTAKEPVDGPDAYERVLLDCIQGDQLRFVSRDEVVAAWRLMETVWSELNATELVSYPMNSDGDAVGGR